jgi:putative copper export protein
VIGVGMLAAALMTLFLLTSKRWVFALLTAAVLAGLLALTPDGHAAVNSLKVFATALGGAR